MQILKLAHQIHPKAVEIRRHLHRYPELSFKEYQTQKYIKKYLSDLGGFDFVETNNTSTIAILKGNKKEEHYTERCFIQKPPHKRRIAFRADIDALPIDEKADVDFRSENSGVMHACGHDAHTANLLAAAQVLCQNRDKFSGEILFIFQHAEELEPGGAVELIKIKEVQDSDLILGQHIWSTLKSGCIALCKGAFMASADTCDLVIHGNGGHGAIPHESVDPIPIAAQIVLNLQQIVSRNIKPIEASVISIGSIHAGTASNIIPSTASMSITIRSMKEEIRSTLKNRIFEVVEGICAANRARAEINYTKGYSATINHPELIERCKEFSLDLFGSQNVIDTEPIMGGEDFSAYRQVIEKAAFIMVGANDPSRTFPHHHEKFFLDESSFENAIAFWLAAAFEFLTPSERKSAN